MAAVILNLPIAPSVNRFEHDKNGRPLGNRSASVQHWRKLADGYLLTQKRRLIQGPYLLTVNYCEQQFGRFDLSNRTKGLEDYLQERNLVEDDRRCWDLHLAWGDVEKDWCRVEIKPRGE